ncbi:unnamed protein product, partial [Urochloa humidicola]
AEERGPQLRAAHSSNPSPPIPPLTPWLPPPPPPHPNPSGLAAPDHHQHSTSRCAPDLTPSRHMAADAARGPRSAHRRRGGGGSGGGSGPRVRPRAWCCSFAGAPDSPDLRPQLPSSAAAAASPAAGRKLPSKSPSAASYLGSPTSSRLAGLGGLIDPRRILSPGRVSPIDPDSAIPPPLPLPTQPPPPAAAAASPTENAAVAVVVPAERAAAVSASAAVAPLAAARGEGAAGGAALDLRLLLRGRDGKCVQMELDSRVLCGCSGFFAAMAPAEDATEGGGAGSAGKRIEVDGVDNLDAFRAAVELMYETDPMRWLAAAGVLRTIDVLEVCSSIMFNRGIKLCLTYIEAVPWSENEEEKLKSLFARFTFDEAISQIYWQDCVHTAGKAQMTSRCSLFNPLLAAPTAGREKICSLW